MQICAGDLGRFPLSSFVLLCLEVFVATHIPLFCLLDKFCLEFRVFGAQVKVRHRYDWGGDKILAPDNL